ncbi:MAG: type II secretion system protein J, partial [Oscillospiraceae bacterium]
MKKILSNKTGFTLAEVIVAFAIFAIMASMIMMLLRLAIASRESNNTYARELSIEQEKLVREPRELTYDDTGLTGEFSFAFDGLADPIVYKYEVHSADPDAEYVEEGINYFVSEEVANYAAGGSGGGFTPP